MAQQFFNSFDYPLDVNTNDSANDISNQEGKSSHPQTDARHLEKALFKVISFRNGDIVIKNSNDQDRMQ